MLPTTEPFAVLSDIDWDDVSFLTDDVPKHKQICTDDILSKIEVVLDSYNDLFSGIGKTDLVTHHIQTTDDVPINLPSYRLPVHLKDKAAVLFLNCVRRILLVIVKANFQALLLLLKNLILIEFVSQ